MDSSITLNELQQKSKQANEVIEKLKHQIEQIKIQTTPGYKTERIKQLKTENESLKKKVEELKKQLEAAEKSTSNFSKLNIIIQYMKLKILKT